MTKVGLVDEVGRSAEFIGDFGQGRLADTQPTQLIDVRGQRPDRPIDVWRGGAPGRWQDLKERHRGFQQRRSWCSLTIPSYGSLTMVDGIAAAVDVATDTTQQPSVCSITSTAASRRSANRLPSSAAVAAPFGQLIRTL